MSPLRLWRVFVRLWACRVTLSVCLLVLCLASCMRVLAYADAGLNGPLLGMKSDFVGMGVVFDVYDNDNQRNNPSIYVLHNEDGSTMTGHEQDFEQTMVKAKPKDVDPARHSYKCSVDIRNLGAFATLHLFVISLSLSASHCRPPCAQGRLYERRSLAWSFCLSWLASSTCLTTGKRSRPLATSRPCVCTPPLRMPLLVTSGFLLCLVSRVCPRLVARCLLSVLTHSRSLARSFVL
jgi:hypothetical protein